MFENAIFLDKKKHARWRFKPHKTYSYAKNVLSAPIAISEVVKASKEFPIIFPAEGKLLPIVQFGVSQNGNLHVTPENDWSARYVPGHIRRYPFVLAKQNVPEKFTLMVAPDRISPNASGEALFDEHGDIPKGGLLDRMLLFLSNFEKELTETEAFLTPLKEKNILIPHVLEFTQDGKVFGKVTGLLIVDKFKLLELDDEILGAWTRSGLMNLIMAHLNSLENANFST